MSCMNNERLIDRKNYKHFRRCVTSLSWFELNFKDNFFFNYTWSIRLIDLHTVKFNFQRFRFVRLSEYCDSFLWIEDEKTYQFHWKFSTWYYNDWMWVERYFLDLDCNNYHTLNNSRFNRQMFERFVIRDRAMQNTAHKYKSLLRNTCQKKDQKYESCRSQLWFRSRTLWNWRRAIHCDFAQNSISNRQEWHTCNQNFWISSRSSFVRCSTKFLHQYRIHMLRIRESINALFNNIAKQNNVISFQLSAQILACEHEK